MKMLRRNLILAAALLPFSGTPLFAEPPVPNGWQLLALPGKPVTRFLDAGDGAIKVAARDSVGFLYCSAKDMPGTGPLLTWRWRVDETPPPTDLSMKGMDDRPLAVHVWFKDEGAADPVWNLRNKLGKWLFDRPVPGKMLTYVWGGLSERGDSLRNPYGKQKGHIIVLRPGDSRSGMWHRETVDYAADFEAAFGYRPDTPTYIAISADTDDKGGASSGIVAGLSFTDSR